MFSVEVLLAESEIAEQLLAALAKRRLEEKFSYWFPLSVRAWLKLCSGRGEYKNFDRSFELVSRSSGGLVPLLSGKSVEVVSLGSGQGNKDLLVLERLKAAGCALRYRPVDSSQALLEMACAAALQAGFNVVGVKADLTSAEHLARLKRRVDNEMKLFLLLGNNLGAFDPLDFSRRVGSLLGPEDLLLIDGEIVSESTLAGYDNPVNRGFAFAPLKSMGIAPDDGELIFELRRDERMPGLWMVTKRFVPARRITLQIGGESIALAPGDKIELGFSYKYTRQAFLQLLEAAGLVPEAEDTSRDGCFIMVAASSR